ncbi:MAG: type II secretion system F family protein [Desulfosarcinaceae bacterium]
MNYYRYKLIAPDGQVVSGVTKLPYQETMSAVNHLERDGSLTLYVKKPGPLGQIMCRLFGFRLKRRLPRLMLAEIFNNLSLMLRAGMPLVTGLKEVAQMDEFPNIGTDVEEIIERVQGGASFSDAAARFPHLFPSSVLHLLRMGEETGKLDEMLKDASAHLQRVQKIVSDTKQALLYPAFVLTAISGGVLFWFAYVVPKIVGLFKELDVTLPPITRALIAISSFVEQYYIHIMVVSLGSLLLVIVLRKKNRAFRKFLDAVLLRLPITKSLMTASVLAYISEYFAMLINAGIDIMQSIRILQDSVANEVYRDKMQDVRGSLETGEGISDSFRQALIFPNFVVRMMSVGENSGTLPEQLTYIADQYREKLTVMVATIGKAIEPLILVVAGSIFAVVIIGLFLPIYDLVSKVSAI